MGLFVLWTAEYWREGGFSFHWTSELLKQTMAELLSMNHHRAPRMDLCTIHGTVHSATDCRHFANSSSCFL